MRIETFATREAWLADRRKSIGASDAAVLCGVGYTSEYALWTDKTSLATLDADDVPEYLEAGTFMEPGIIAWWSHRSGLVANTTSLTIIRDPAFPWMHASPDALVGDDAGLDAKNVDISKAADWADGVPLKHQVQGQHSMAVTGRARWHFGAVVGGRKLLMATVERDEDFIAHLRERERQWWERHVVGREAPPPDGTEASTRALRAAFPGVSSDSVVPLGPAALELHERILAASAVAKEAKDEVEDCRNKLRAMVGDAEFGVLPGGVGMYRRKLIQKKPYQVAASSYVDFKFTEKEIQR